MHFSGTGDKLWFFDSPARTLLRHLQTGNTGLCENTAEPEVSVHRGGGGGEEGAYTAGTKSGEHPERGRRTGRRERIEDNNGDPTESISL